MDRATSSAMLVAFGVVVLTMLGNTVLEWVKRLFDHRHEATTLRRALLEELKQARDTITLNSQRTSEPIEGGSFLIPVPEGNPIYDASITKLGLLRPNEVSAVVRAYGMLQAMVETYAAIGTFHRNDGPVLHAVVDAKWAKVLEENTKGLGEVLDKAVDALEEPTRVRQAGLGTRALWAILAVSVAAALLLKLWSGYQAFAATNSHYLGLPPRASMQEVQYRLGIPEEVLDQVRPGPWGKMRALYYTDTAADPANAMPKGKEIEDFSGWVYHGHDGIGEVTVEFDTAKRLQSLRCASQNTGVGKACPLWRGAAINLPEDRMVAALGQPKEASYVGSSKIASYPDDGLELQLVKGKIYAIKVSDQNRPSLGEYLKSLVR